MVGDTVRVQATGIIMTVRKIVYLGFEDRLTANGMSEPRFMLSPKADGTDLVNATDCEKT